MGDTPKWLVYFRENPYLQMDDEMGYPYFSGMMEHVLKKLEVSRVGTIFYFKGVFLRKSSDYSWWN